MSCEKLIDLRKFGGKWIDMCDSKWEWKNGNTSYNYGGGGYIPMKQKKIED